MNDRFSAQLRQHLLDTADERPANGQLAAVVEAVEVTRQRPSLAARLTFNPGRIGPLPAAPLRYGLIATGLVLAAMAGAMLGGGTTSAPTTVFEGAWTSIDPGDGSGMTLVVGAGETPAVYFEDGYASGDACVNDPVKRFTARGTGVISGDRLVATFPDGGGCGLLTVGVNGNYEYQPASDSLIDQNGLIWSRALGGNQPATQAPQVVDFPPLTTTFVSPTNGYSVKHLAGRGFTPATELWDPDRRDPGAPQFPSESPHDAFDYSETGHAAVFMGASTEIPDGVSIDDWLDTIVVEHSGGGCMVPRSQQAEIVIDGQSGRISECPNEIVATVVAGGRLYQFTLWHSRDGDARAVFDAFVATIDLRPEDAAQPSSASPTPPLGVETFTSAIHGISIDHPSGWAVIPATQPWSGEVDDLDLPWADFLFDPAYDSRLVLLIASQPYGNLTQAEWWALTLEGICGGDAATAGSFVVDGENSVVFSCPHPNGASISEGVLIRAEERGYLIFFLDRGDGTPRTDSYDDEWFRAMLESVDLRPENAVDGSGASTDGPGASTDIPTFSGEPDSITASPQILP